MVETAHGLARQLKVRQLILPHGHPLGPMLDDVGSHEYRIAEEAVIPQILCGDFLLLFLVGGIAFQPAERSDHGKQKMQFRRLLDVGLTVYGALVRVKPHGEPVQHHFPHIFAQTGGVGVVTGQGVPVRHEEEGFHLLLHGHPVFQRAEIVADMQRPGGPHAGYSAFLRHDRYLRKQWSAKQIQNRR